MRPYPVLPLERVDRTIVFLRGQRVILDADLARLYGVTTKRLNQQVNRNRSRFPEDFMFQLTSEEKTEVVANCDHLSKLKFSPVFPYAFTEHGAIMAASVLNTPRAIETSVLVVRAFVRLREMVATHRELARKLAELGFVSKTTMRKSRPSSRSSANSWPRRTGQGDESGLRSRNPRHPIINRQADTCSQARFRYW
jgi:hypothetical protein